LKIDRSFVQGVATNDNDAAIARAIIGMAHALRERRCGPLAAEPARGELATSALRALTKSDA
jgi:predicted signal transduction protein with EAL and GGDEF domain